MTRLGISLPLPYVIATLVAALVTGVIALAATGMIFASDHGLAWPTPPPGPNPQVPRVYDSSQIDLVNPPQVLGATVWVVDPIAAQVPLFPPTIKTELQTTDGLRIIVGAGSTTETLQLVYEPIPVAEAPQPGPKQELRRVFDLRAYDHRGNETGLDLQRPWLLEIQLQGLLQNVESPSRLILARYTDGSRWTPLVTTYYRLSGLLKSQIMEAGLFAVILESSIITGKVRSNDLRTASVGLAGK